MHALGFGCAGGVGPPVAAFLRPYPGGKLRFPSFRYANDPPLHGFADFASRRWVYWHWGSRPLAAALLHERFDFDLNFHFDLNLDFD